MNQKNIIIIGAGIAGRLLSVDISHNHPDICVVGVVDDVANNKKSKIIGKIEDLGKIIDIYKIDEIVIAIPSASGDLVRRIILKNINNRVPTKIVPRDLMTISQNNVKYKDVKNIESQDFLGRPFIHKNIDSLSEHYSGQIVLVTGGAGSIGSEIVKQLIELGTKKVIVYDNSEYLIFNLDQMLRESGIRDRCKLIIGNILNKEKLNLIVSKEKPDLIIHAAAYKHVYLMEDNVDEAVMNNIFGTKNVVDVAISNKIKKFTLISTDKVVNPTSIMGSTKKICELYVNSIKSKHTKFNIVRFGNVINSNGSVLPLFERQIKFHKYVTVTHKDIKRFFMSIREAAQLVIESTSRSSGESIYILNMGELINIYEIALCTIRSQNLIPNEDVEVKIIGLKKGEKLIEELFTDVEKRNMAKTDVENVFKVKAHDQIYPDIKNFIFQLNQIIQNSESHSIRKILMDYLRPTQINNNK